MSYFYKELEQVNEFLRKYTVLDENDRNWAVREISYERENEDELLMHLHYKEFKK